MRACITLSSSRHVKLGMDYQHQIQAMIYRVMDNVEMKTFLHDHGFTAGERHFRGFVFSRLMGKSSFLREEKKFVFTPPVYFYLASPWKDFLRSFIHGLMMQSEILLGYNVLQLGNVSFEQEMDFSAEKPYLIQMISPVTMYSTLSDIEGRKKTYYYAPTEREFSEKIRLNLINKAHAFYDKDWSDLPFSIEPAGTVRSSQQKILMYKGNVIKGWMGNYYIAGDPLMLSLAYDAAIGGKNSQGMGMFAIIDRNLSSFGN